MGFAGVSAYTRRVVGRSAARKASTLERSARLTSTPPRETMLLTSSEAPA
jgi:hypothetical protein